MRVDQITKDQVEALRFGSSAANGNCALRTLRRMLHKGEEWNFLVKIPKFKLWPEQGRRLRLDEEAEQKLLAAANSCDWKRSIFELFRDVIILARDTGMRNRRHFIVSARKTWIGTIESFFVPDSKTVDGRRMIPMSDRAYEVLRARGAGKRGGLVVSFRSFHGVVI